MKAFSSSSILSIVLSSALVVTPIWAQAPAPDSLQIRLLNADSLQQDAYSGARQLLSVEVTDSSGAAVASAAVTCRLPDSGATGTFGDGTHAAVAYTDAQGHANIDEVHWGAAEGPVALRITATKGTVHTGILVETTLRASVAPLSVTPAAPQPIAPAPVVSQPAVSVTKPEARVAKQPGQIASQPALADPGPNKLTPNAADPLVSVSKTPAADAPHTSQAKWYILAVVAVAAGAGAAFAMKGKGSSSSSASSSPVSITSSGLSVGPSH